MEYNWSTLSHLQVGRYSEYFVKMAFTLQGFEVYTTEVDDHGVDFIAKLGGHYFEVQVKSLREVSGYAFMSKSKFDITQKNLLLALVILKERVEPEIYLIVATEWTTPNELLKDRDFEGKKSAPEYGVNISGKTRGLLEQYDFDKVMGELRATHT